MKIRYAGPMRDCIIRDVLDPDLRNWQVGEVKDVADDRNANVIESNPSEREPGAPPSTCNAVRAILNAGVAFVDDSTGKNPLFQCASCGEHADSEMFRPGNDSIRYRTDDDKPLCVPCFLVAHPEWERYHADRGLPQRHREKIAGLRAAVEAAAAKPAPSRSYAAPEPAHVAEEN
jgi:hypothetical protein